MRTKQRSSWRLEYDLLWYIFRFGDMVDGSEEDGGVEASIRKFSLVMTIIALVCKVIMVFVFWMASHRVEDIIDERSDFI